MSALRLALPVPHSRAAYLAITISTGLAILLLIASALLGASNVQKIGARERVAAQARAAELATETLLSTLKDAETGQRGFLLTGDDSYPAPYEAARSRLDHDFSQLEAAPLIDPARARLIEHMRILAAARLEVLARTIMLYRFGQLDASLALVRTNRGKQMMDAIRADADALQTDVAAKTIERNRPPEDARPWIAVFGLVTLACLLFGGVALAQRRARIHIANSLSRLERFTRAFSLSQGMMRELDGRIIFWSAGAERLYGYRRDQALGRSSHELLRTRFPQPLSQIQAQLHHDGHWQGELAHVRQGGTEIFVASYWALHHGDVGEKDVIIEINNDITSLKRTEAELRDSEVKLRLALDASGQSVWQWDLTGGIGQMICDDGCKALFGITDNVPLSYEQWTRTLTADRRVAAEAALARALDPADPHDDYAGEHHFTRSDGETLWLIAAGRALFQQDPTTPAGRRPLRVIGTIRDVSEIRRSEQERQRSEALLRTIVETAPALIYAKDRDSRMLLANEPVMALIGKPWDQVQGRTDAEFLDNADQARAVLLNDRRVMATGQTERLEELVGGADGQARVWVSIKAPMCGPDGAVIGLVGISVEITEHKRAQDRLRLMVNELNHRVKNTLSTVQALTTQTLRGLDPAMRQNLEARLLALSSAHDVLTRQGWESGSLRDLVSEALIPFDGWNAARFWISGPPISLRPSAVLAMAMGLHELATNALKYGALSDASGRVEIHWETTVDDEPLLRFLWTERHGPIVCVPTNFGFGTKLIERTLARDLRGTSKIIFDDPGGVTCRIEVPLAEVIATAEAVSFPRVGDV